MPAPQKVDARQSRFVGILQQLFPWFGGKPLDVLLSSVNAEVTPPLTVDAQNPASLTINIGGAIVPNPQALRNHSMSFVGNTIPTFASGTVTFPSSSGGNITASTGGSFVLTVPSGQFVKVLLMMDSGGNIQAAVGTPDPVEGNAAVPAPFNATLPFAYVSIQNLGGTIQNVAQNKIFQLTDGGGSGAMVGVAEEVSVGMNTLSRNVLFPSPLTNNLYVVDAAFVNLSDPFPDFQPITITQKTKFGFVASWNAPTDSLNYALDYIVPGVQSQTGEAAISNGATSITVTLPVPLSSANYVVIPNLVNLVDANPDFQPLTITAKTSTSFTVSWNAPVDTTNYRLAFEVAEYT